MTQLTDRQREVFVFIREFQDVRHKPPTVREIQAHFGYASLDTVVGHLAGLERKGFIRRVPGESRNIELPDVRTVLGVCTDQVE